MNSIDAIKQANDNVNHPQHYNKFGMETIDIIENSMTKEQFKGYLKGNVIKYITRFEHKNGVEDLEKAVWHLNKLKEDEVKTA